MLFNSLISLHLLFVYSSCEMNVNILKLIPKCISNILHFIFTVPDEPAFVGEIAENDYFDIDKERTRIMLGFSWKVCLYYTLQYMLYTCTCIKFGHS